MKDEALIAYAKDLIDISDEDIAKIDPEKERELKN